MYKREIILKNPNGLHARPASQFMQQASKYQSEIHLEMEDKVINPKSILSLLSAGIKYNSRFTITAAGKDEQQAVEELAAFLEASRD